MKINSIDLNLFLVFQAVYVTRSVTLAGERINVTQSAVSNALKRIRAIATPEDAAYVNERTDCVGFVGASSLERLAVEDSLTQLTKRFKKIPVRKEALRPFGK